MESKKNEIRYGLILKQIRIKAEYSRNEFAKLLGVSRMTIYRWEDDTFKPSEFNLIKIANLVGISYTQLIEKINGGIDND